MDADGDSAQSGRVSLGGGKVLATFAGSYRPQYSLSLKLILVASVFALLAASVFSIDADISAWTRGLDLPGDLAKAINLSEAFAHGFGALVILATVWIVAVERRAAVWLAFCMTASSGLAANGLKSCFVRVRPHASSSLMVIDHFNSSDEGSPSADGKERVTADFWDARQRSFPSGHAATAWGLAIGLSFIFPRGWWLFAMLAVTASLQRLVSGAHYPSDVLAGAAIAFLSSSLTLGIATWVNRTRELQ